MKKKKRRHGQKIEKPEAVMANFFKALEIYQTKILVSFFLKFYSTFIHVIECLIEN